MYFPMGFFKSKNTNSFIPLLLIQENELIVFSTEKTSCVIKRSSSCQCTLCKIKKKSYKWSDWINRYRGAYIFHSEAINFTKSQIQYLFNFIFIKQSMMRCFCKKKTTYIHYPCKSFGTTTFGWCRTFTSRQNCEHLVGMGVWNNIEIVCCCCCFFGWSKTIDRIVYKQQIAMS